MTAAFQMATADADGLPIPTGFEEMNKWANFYANNVQTKYEQVGRVLIRDPPKPNVLPPIDPENLDNFNAVITGKNGFGSVEEAIRPVLANLLNTWGQCRSAQDWLDGMMSISTKDMESAGILTEFRKHVDLIPPFAKEAVDAFREIDSQKTIIAESNLESYLQRCGTFTSKIDTLKSWIELMSITGDVHGSTLGFTRLIAMPDVMRWRSAKSPIWEAGDIEMITRVSATAIGMEDGRHVMTSTIGGPYSPKLQAVLDKYDEKVTALKETYETKIQKDPDFNDFGWILSSYCTDGFDSKQLTSATYI